MGRFFGWLQCDDVAELEKEKERLTAEIKAIDEKIAKLKGND